MDNALLYVSIIAFSLAFILAIPRMVDFIGRIALKIAYKTRKNITKNIELNHILRSSLLNRIAVCEEFERTIGPDPGLTENVSDALDSIADCDRLLAHLESANVMNEKQIAVLERFYK